MNDDTFINKKITNQDVYKEVQKHHTVLNEILEQTKKTNGRVTVLEKKSIGVWIANHPFKFTVFVLVFVSIVISDLRHPLLDLLTSTFL